MNVHWDQEAYLKAYWFAAQAHTDTEKPVPGTNIPYIMHVSFVSMEIIAALAAEQVENENLAVQCAILHDTIEDTSITYQLLLKEEFGQSAADGVLALTKNESVGTGIKDKWKRKRLILEDSLERIKTQPHEVWMVKIADRITNLQPPPKDWNDEKIEHYKDDAFLIHRSLAGASNFLSDRLKRKIEVYPEPN